MNRHRVLSVLIGLIAAGEFTTVNAARPPNLILIVADDLRHDLLGAAGNRVIQTPHLDRLARDGVRFQNMFVTTAICAASRASIFTGLYERTHRYTFRNNPIQAVHWNQSYPVLLKQAGYRTGFVGKFGVGVEEGAISQAFDDFAPLDQPPYFKTQAEGTHQHLTDIEGDRALAFLESCTDQQPFCLSLSFNAPHAADAAPQQYFWSAASDELYKDAIFPIPSTMTAEFFQRQPKFLRESESRVRFQWRFDEPAKYQTMVRGYYRMITDVDRVVGRLREALRQRGKDRQTVILFTSDNGYFLGERGFADKWYLYEPSVRVPFIVYDPRQEHRPGRGTSDSIGLNVDLAPTVLDLAGVQIPASYQGHSLRSDFDPDIPVHATPRTDFFYEHLFERANIPKSEGVRNQQFAYIRWFEQKPVVEELYDHLADPEEVHNLIADPRYAETRDRLRKRTTALRDLYGGPFISNLKPDKLAK